MQTLTTQEWLAPLHDRGLVPEGALAAYVVGSAARGWNNARSDFDIYVVTAAPHESATDGPIPYRSTRRS